MKIFLTSWTLQVGLSNLAVFLRGQNPPILSAPIIEGPDNIRIRWYLAMIVEFGMRRKTTRVPIEDKHTTGFMQENRRVC